MKENEGLLPVSQTILLAFSFELRCLVCETARFLSVRLRNELAMTQEAIEVRGAPDHLPTAGTLCTKVARYLDRTYSDERVLYPMRRVGMLGISALLLVSRSVYCAGGGWHQAASSRVSYSACIPPQANLARH